MPRSTGARAATKSATREALLDAGLAELVERGPDASSLDAICARAGKTRGAFYVHFADREAFLIAVMDRVLGDFLRELGAGGRTRAGLRGAIEQFAAAAAARAPAVHSDRAIRFHHLLAACHGSPAIGDRYRALLAGITRAMAATAAADQATGRLRADLAPEAIVELGLALALGLVAMIELDHPCDPARIADTVLTALAPPAAAPPKPRARARART